jgi:hypothetical protein
MIKFVTSELTEKYKKEFKFSIKRNKMFGTIFIRLHFRGKNYCLYF